MQDIVSRTEVFESLLESTPASTLMRGRVLDASRPYDELTAWSRRAVHEGGWKSGVESGDIPAWQRAFAHIVSLQDVLRAFDGRLRDGSPRVGSVERKERVVGAVTNPDGIAPTVIAYTPPAEPPPPKDTVPLVRHADVAGYEYDPSWVNGGVAAFRPEHRAAQQPERELHGVPKFKTSERQLATTKTPNVFGIKAFESVEDAECEGIPELAWFYCGADCELGVFSSLEGFIVTCLHGGPEEGSTGTCPSGPGEHTSQAAALHRVIMANLTTLPHRHQRALRDAYRDQRYPRAWVLDHFGVGITAIVWEAARKAGEKTLPKSTEPELTTKTLAVLEGWARADWPTFEASQEGAAEELLARLKRAAAIVLMTAHERYRAAAAEAVTARQRAKGLLEERARQKAAQAPSAKPKTRRVKSLVPAGEKGRAKRRLVVEVIEVALPDDGAPRAA
jgi:hypothetical protein